MERLRRDLEHLIGMLSGIEGLKDLALTTNGSLLTLEKALALRAAGLQRITVSLDSLDDTVFRAMNDVDFPVNRVLAAIDAAAEAGLSPIKIDVATASTDVDGRVALVWTTLDKVNRALLVRKGGEDAFERLGYAADLGTGGFYLVARMLESSGADVSHADGDYGTRFLAPAGVLNLLAALHAYEAARGRKA